MVGQAQHAEGVAEPQQAGQEWHQQGDLQGPVPGVVVDGQDLCLHLPAAGR